MKVIYDQATDTLNIIFTDHTVIESDEEKPGIIIDYDEEGNLVALEILDASLRVQTPNQIEYRIAPVPSMTS